MQLNNRILAFNTGSSSIKFALYEVGEESRVIFSGSLTRIGSSGGSYSLFDGGGRSLASESASVEDHVAACEFVFSRLTSYFAALRPDAIGHRMVHGGPLFSEPQVVTRQLIASLEELSPFAPEHLPPALKALRHLEKLFPGTLQVACFDTSFHATMPSVAKLYALPQSVRSAGVRRYGFHGLSYEYILGELLKQASPGKLEGRIIMAHLGHGASMVAVRDGRSIETTMGFSPAGGLVMSTRTGDLDPGVILFLLEQGRMTPAEIKELVTRRSGLLGISGRTDDMRELLNAEEADSAAREAVELFCYQARKSLGSLAAVLGGVDRLIFSGGIGENSAEIRSRLSAGLEFLGIRIDEAKNREHAAVISHEEGAVEINIINTNEELMIARHTLKVLKARQLKEM
ncbi:acetate/propionate family kinase [Chlorobium ferrooxidans]|uniref:Acetate kinase n=1 Tax=Chlorobium ferrooxidans DSM 13031 TaxID=377431 RepID=Q0YRQ2_9CHLB|nr:acetate/propionate family kinase [Chlorobium ferrooxidans]EAT58961.1 acetate kinase [Chlorobium ferrooxidans DSM 13031]